VSLSASELDSASLHNPLAAKLPDLPKPANNEVVMSKSTHCASRGDWRNPICRIKTARMMMDYILQRFQLPPAALRLQHNTAVFGLEPLSSNPTPSDAVKEIIEGIGNSYDLLYNV
jgi:hypothetical protein